MEKFNKRFNHKKWFEIRTWKDGEKEVDKLYRTKDENGKWTEEDRDDYERETRKEYLERLEEKKKELPLIENEMESIKNEIVELQMKLEELKMEKTLICEAMSIDNKNKENEKRLKEFKEIDNINTWLKAKEGYREGELIENATYKLFISTYNDYDYMYVRDENGKLKDEREKVLSGVYVSYDFTTNSDFIKFERIASIERKQFRTEEEANKYIEGRKKYFSKYFKEDKPKLENASEYIIYHYGVKLEGYEIKE